VKPKILQSTDAHAPLTRITSVEDFKTILKAMLVTGIPEIGGTCGWSELFDDEDGLVLRDGNTGNTRDWIFRGFQHNSYNVCDIRGCDTASSSNTGVNIFPSEAIKPPMDTTSAHYNSSPTIHLFGKGTYFIENWVIIATDKVVYIFTENPYSSYKTQYINENYGWQGMCFGHFKGHGANVETAFVSGVSFYSESYTNSWYLFGTSASGRYIQRTPDGDVGDGAIEVNAECDKVMVRKEGEGNISRNKTLSHHMHTRTGLPNMTTIEDPIITSDVWMTQNRVAIGKMYGIKNINAYGLPPLAQGNVSTLADGKDYAIFKWGGDSYANGAAVLFNLSDDWDA
jgi:hypothetical protein